MDPVGVGPRRDEVETEYDDLAIQAAGRILRGGSEDQLRDWLTGEFETYWGLPQVDGMARRLAESLSLLRDRQPW